jgi:uncharacterized protein involved in type VI secretion and phage assembly
MPETRAPRFKVDGTAATAAALGRIIDVRVDRRLNLTGSATIRCSGTQEGLPFKMGSVVEITSPAGDEAFSGVVTAVEVERYDAQHRVTTYGLLDHSWKLRHTSQAAARLETTVGDVVRELVSGAGLSAEIDATPAQYKYLLQNGNDLDYVDGLLAREGLDWWCEGKTFFAKGLNAGNSMTRKVKAVELERLSVRASAVRPDTVVVRGWSSTHDAVSGRKDLQASDLGAEGAMATLALKGVDDGKQVHNTASLPVIDANEANRLAEAALLRAASTAVRAELEGPGLWAVNPGEVVEVVDGDDATGAYLVTEVQHRFADGVATSRIISGDRRPPSIEAGGGPVDSNAALLHGIVVAQVTDLGDPDKKGRVRARFPGLDQQQESDWARVSSIAAGKGRGSSIRPEVGDEVLMAFEGGDLRKPVVLGSLFTSKTALPTLELGGSSFTKATVLHQFGHQILMWGGGGADEGLELQLKSGASLVMDDKQIHVKGVSAQTKTLLEHGESSIELKPDGTITIKGTKIVLNAVNDVEINGMNVKAVAKTSAAIEGAMVEIKGKATGTFNGGGMLELKGGMVKIN